MKHPNRPTTLRRLGESADNISTQAVTIGDVLHGSCSYEALLNCSTDHLENLLFKVLDLTASVCDNGSSVLKQPSWWPDNVLPFAEIKAFYEQVKKVIASWHSALAHILESCVRFYGELRKSMVVLQHQCSADLVKSDCTTHEMNSLLPVVLLKDVLKCKYPVLEKTDYMHFLKLQPNDTVSQQKPNSFMVDSTENLRYSHKIDFSSEVGQKFLTRKRYTFNERLFQRKCDWTDKYLATDAERNGSRSDFSDVAYFRKFTKRQQNGGYIDRVYKFPERQYGQFQRAISRFSDIFCRPAYVSVKRLNIQPYLLKRKMCRRLSIYVDNTETDRVNKQYEDAKTSNNLVSSY